MQIVHCGTAFSHENRATLGSLRQHETLPSRSLGCEHRFGCGFFRRISKKLMQRLLNGEPSDEKSTAEVAREVILQSLKEWQEMSRSCSLTLTAGDHRLLMRHLFPSEGCEAVAIALCGRMRGEERHRLLVRKLLLVPYDECSFRAPDRVTWPTHLIVPLIEVIAMCHDFTSRGDR